MTGSTQHSEDFRPNLDLGEFAATPVEIDTFAAQPTALPTGADGNYEEEKHIQPVDNPDATRWVFNPYAVVDLTNLAHGCGFSYLKNVVFNRVRSINTAVAKSIDETGNAEPPLPGGHLSHSDAHYNKEARTSYMIARELVERHGDKGVVIVSELTGMEEDAGRINKLLFGDNVKAVEDVNEDGRPIPILPNLLETLRANAQEAMRQVHPDDQDLVRSVAERCRESIRLAIRHARLTIDEAQKRFLEEKNPNRYFSNKEKRAYLALGQEIPNQLPLTTASAAGMAGAGVSGQAIADAVVAGVKTAMGGVPQPVPGVAAPDFVDPKELEKLEAEANEPIAPKPKAKPKAASIATGASEE